MKTRLLLAHKKAQMKRFTGERHSAFAELVMSDPNIKSGFKRAFFANLPLEPETIPAREEPEERTK